MMCVVQKEFVANGEEHVRNQLVDGDLFRNTQVLISQRLLRHATHDEVESAHFEEERKVAPTRKKLRAKVAQR